MERQIRGLTGLDHSLWPRAGGSPLMTIVINAVTSSGTHDLASGPLHGFLQNKQTPLSAYTPRASGPEIYSGAAVRAAISDSRQIDSTLVTSFARRVFEESLLGPTANAKCVQHAAKMILKSKSTSEECWRVRTRTSSAGRRLLILNLTRNHITIRPGGGERRPQLRKQVAYLKRKKKRKGPINIAVTLVRVSLKARSINTRSAENGTGNTALTTAKASEGSQTTVEIRKAADELFRLSEMDVKACTKQRKRRTKEKQKEHTFPIIFIDTL
ncbi:hypothetical protein EVAR_33457_1 [Eumeta japonica]|uniref:Uncharacterized protein n=1 Tax=Eumeta variegata TaxID=151549 RepID=A0A4C1WF42_EUMVA|nr:hypothetical protein EVAR_33457_1 [Eumeta japonica]